jgi:hypothetical protein
MICPSVLPLATGPVKSCSAIGRRPLNPSAHAAVAAAFILSAGLMPVSDAWARGQVQVSFTQVDRYADAGIDAVERERNLKVLAEHMQGWSSRLPDGQQLDIEVLDVDLAGEQRLALLTLNCAS